MKTKAIALIVGLTFIFSSEATIASKVDILLLIIASCEYIDVNNPI